MTPWGETPLPRRRGDDHGDRPWPTFDPTRYDRDIQRWQRHWARIPLPRAQWYDEPSDLLDRQCAIAHVQTIKAIGNAASATLTTATFTSTSGNLLVACCQWSGAATFTSIGDSKSNTWTQVGTEGSNGVKCRMYYAKNITGGASHTVNFVQTNSPTAFPLLFVTEFSGLDTAAPFDVQAQNTGSSTAPNSGTTATRSRASSVLFAQVANNSSGTITYTAGSGYTIPTNGSEGNGASNATGAVEYQIVSAVGTDAGAFTISPTNNWICQIAVFMAPSASAPTWGFDGTPSQDAAIAAVLTRSRAQRTDATKADSVGPLRVADVTLSVPALSGWVQPARRPFAPPRLTQHALASPLLPTQTPNVEDWGSAEPDVMRPPLRALGGGAVDPQRIADVTTAVPSLPGWWAPPPTTRAAERRTPDPAVAPGPVQTTVAAATPSVASWQATIPIPEGMGVVQYQMLGQTAWPAIPDLIGVESGWVPRAVPLLRVTLQVAPVAPVTAAAAPTLPWEQASEPVRPPARPAWGTGRVEPSRLADVTATAPALSWRGSYADRVDPPARVQPLPGVWSVYTPPTLAAPTTGYVIAPDVPTPRIPYVYVLRSTFGMAGFDLSTTARPAFGGQQLTGWKLVQYTSLVGNLTPDAVPTQFWGTGDLAFRAVWRRPGAATMPEFPIPTQVPALSWQGWFPAKLDRARGVGSATPEGRISPLPIPPVPAPALPHLASSQPVVAKPQAVGVRPAVVLPVLPVNLIPPPRGVGADYPDWIAARWRWLYEPMAAPLKPDTDPFAPEFGRVLFPPPAVPGLRPLRSIPAGAVAPLRVQDVTTAVTALAWQGRYPDQIARRELARLGLHPLVTTAAFPGLDPTRQGWRPIFPDAIARRELVVAARPSVVLQTPSPYPIPGVTSWRPTYPDRLDAAARAIANGGWAFEPFARPNPASPDLAWQGWQPPFALPPARALDRGGASWSPRTLPFVPDHVGGLISAPSWLARAVVLPSLQPRGVDRFEAPIPDLRRDWGTSYPDRVPGWGIRPLPAGSNTAPEGNRAVSPVDWFTVDPVAPPRRLTDVKPGSVGPNPQVIIAPAVSLLWLPQAPMPRAARPISTGPTGLLTLPPDIIATAVPVVHLRPVRVTRPRFASMRLWRRRVHGGHV